MNEQVWLAIIAAFVAIASLIINSVVAYMNNQANKKVTEKVEEKAAIQAQKLEKIESKVDEAAGVHSQKLDYVAEEINGRISKLLTTIAAEKLNEGILRGTREEQERVAIEKVAEAKAKAILEEENHP